MVQRITGAPHATTQARRSRARKRRKELRPLLWSWSFTMAFALIASFPVILMFLLVQKWFLVGLTAGAVKG